MRAKNYAINGQVDEYLLIGEVNAQDQESSKKSDPVLTETPRRIDTAAAASEPLKKQTPKSKKGSKLI